jgi:hypothetical protein
VRRELEPPRAVGKALEGIGRRLQGESGLAAPAGAGQGQRRVSASAQLAGQIVGERVERGAKRPEVGGQLGMDESVDVLRVAEVAQPVDSEIN